MDKKKLLIVDDQPDVCELLALGLAGDFDVSFTDDPDIAYGIATRNTPDIILLDIHLQGASGIELCARLRQNQMTKRTPILIFTGQGSKERMLESYGVGADDYLEKPVDLDVIRSRLFARIKRVVEISGSGESFENLRIFADRQEVELNGSVQKLSEIEFRLLRIFLANPNKKISREEILSTIWNNTQVEVRTVDVHVCSLRKKLKDFNHHIDTLYGRGYILRPAATGY